MKLNLAVRRMTKECVQYNFDRFPLIIGRSEDADITLDDRWVSRRHCLIDCHEGVFIVRDLDSKHGTLLNEDSISEAVLHPGDSLSIGLSILTATYETTGIEELHDADNSQLVV